MLSAPRLAAGESPADRDEDSQAPFQSSAPHHANRTPSAVSEAPALTGTLIDRALALLRDHPARPLARKDFLAAMPDIAGGQWQTLAKQLAQHAEVIAEGERRGRKYRWTGGAAGV